MPGTFTQLYVQCIFAVKGRQKLLNKTWREDVFKYMAGILTNKGQKPIIINGVEDHVHLLIGLTSSVSISELIRDVKNNSSQFINNHNWVRGKFYWQEGYGAFTYSHSQLDMIYNYVKNQEEHHKVKSFKEKYLAFLNKFNVTYEEKYVFD